MRPVHVFTSSVVALIAVIVFVPSGRGEEAPATAPTVIKSAREIELEKKIEDLQSENDRLRAELKAGGERRRIETFLRPQRGILRAPDGSLNLSPDILKNAQPATPDGWVPKEINGLRYYIVPLKAGE